jgi:hypothetical protein
MEVLFKKRISPLPHVMLHGWMGEDDISYLIPNATCSPSPSLFPFLSFLLPHFTHVTLFSPFLSFLPFFFSPTPHTETQRQRETESRERDRVKRERERESCCMEEEKREEKRGFWKAPSSRHLRLRSTIIRGPMKLKFCKEVHNT